MYNLLVADKKYQVIKKNTDHYQRENIQSASVFLHHVTCQVQEPDTQKQKRRRRTTDRSACLPVLRAPRVMQLELWIIRLRHTHTHTHTNTGQASSTRDQSIPQSGHCPRDVMFAVRVRSVTQTHISTWCRSDGSQTIFCLPLPLFCLISQFLFRSFRSCFP